MLIIPELETVVILVPRTASGDLYRKALARWPKSFLLYRHMEADGIPAGYNRWRKLGVVRHPLQRLWSLYSFLQNFAAGRPYEGSEYARQLRQSVCIEFPGWVTQNTHIFTSAHHTCGSRFDPLYTNLHTLPENCKSQFLYLRPDLGTRFFRYESHLNELYAELDISTSKDGTNSSLRDRYSIPLTPEIFSHMEKHFVWELEDLGYEL